MGTSSVTASPIHKIGLPDHERATISATDKHAFWKQRHNSGSHAPISFQP
jgi:hypothetical protein